MAKLTDSERDAILARLLLGRGTDQIASELGVPPGRVRAVAAHRTRGSYDKDAPAKAERAKKQLEAGSPVSAVAESTQLPAELVRAIDAMLKGLPPSDATARRSPVWRAMEVIALIGTIAAGVVAVRELFFR